MIVDNEKFVIDVNTYRPLVMVRNGISSRLFTDGLVELDKVKKLRLPKARFDYLLHVKTFTWTSGVKSYVDDDVFYIDKRQTELELNYSDALAMIEAELITEN